MKRIYIQRGGYTFKEALSCKNTILVFIVNLVELQSNSHIKYIYSLSMGQEGPHTMRKPPVAWKGAAPLKPPVSLEARMVCAAIINNAVPSSSCVTLDLPLALLLEHIAMPTPADYAEHAAREKAKMKKTRRGAKKGKKDSVHMAPLDPSLKGKNIVVFRDDKIPKEDMVSNPIDAESRETLFIPDPQDCYNHDNIKVNPKHPIAPFYQLLMDCYEQDPSGESFKRIIDPYLNAPSDGEQDSSDEEMGCSP